MCNSPCRPAARRSRALSTPGALGIPEVPKPPELAKRGGCWFERGALKVHLGVERDFRAARKAHPAPGGCLTNARLLRPPPIGRFPQSFPLHSPHYARETIAEIGSMEVALATAIISQTASTVRDLPLLIEKLRGLGYAVKEDGPLEGFERVYVDDPFGNRIELLAPVAPP